MKRQIIVTIEPDANGVRCGVCTFMPRASGSGFCRLSVSRDGCSVRGPECLAAEKLLADLVAFADLNAQSDFNDPQYRSGLQDALAAIDAQVKP